MNRTGLVIALAVAATVGLVFRLRPDLDLKLATLFFDPERGGFWRAYDPIYLRARDVAVWLVTLVAAPAGGAPPAPIFFAPPPPLLPPPARSGGPPAGPPPPPLIRCRPFSFKKK